MERNRQETKRFIIYMAVFLSITFFSSLLLQDAYAWGRWGPRNGPLRQRWRNGRGIIGRIMARRRARRCGGGGGGGGGAASYGSGRTSPETTAAPVPTADTPKVPNLPAARSSGSSKKSAAATNDGYQAALWHFNAGSRPMKRIFKADGHQFAIYGIKGGPGPTKPERDLVGFALHGDYEAVLKAAKNGKRLTESIIFRPNYPGAKDIPTKTWEVSPTGLEKLVASLNPIPVKGFEKVKLGGRQIEIFNGDLKEFQSRFKDKAVQLSPIMTIFATGERFRQARVPTVNGMYRWFRILENSK